MFFEYHTKIFIIVKNTMDPHSFHALKYSEGCLFARFFIFWVENLNSDLSSFNLVTLKLMSHYYLNQSA